MVGLRPGLRCKGREPATVRALVARAASLFATEPRDSRDAADAFSDALARCGTTEAERTLSGWLDLSRARRECSTRARQARLATSAWKTLRWSPCSTLPRDPKSRWAPRCSLSPGSAGWANRYRRASTRSRSRRSAALALACFCGSRARACGHARGAEARRDCVQPGFTSASGRTPCASSARSRRTVSLRSASPPNSSPPGAADRGTSGLARLGTPDHGARGRSWTREGRPTLERLAALPVPERASATFVRRIVSLRCRAAALIAPDFGDAR